MLKQSFSMKRNKEKFIARGSTAFVFPFYGPRGDKSFVPRQNYKMPDDSTFLAREDKRDTKI